MKQGADSATGRGEGLCRAEDLKGVLQQLADQIADADRRHSAALVEMHQRLGRLGGQTETIKATLPKHLASAFERIEVGMSELADRLAETERDRQPEVIATPHDDWDVASPIADGASVASTSSEIQPVAVIKPMGPAGQLPPSGPVVAEPMPAAGSSASMAIAAAVQAAMAQPAPPPLKSAIGIQPPGTWGRAEPSFTSTFSDTSSSAQFKAEPVYRQNPDDPWDDHAAEALARLYESGEPGLPPPLATLEAAPAVFAFAAAPVQTPAPTPAGQGATALDGDTQRVWLESRLSDIAQRVEQSLLDLRPEASLAAFGQRFDHFEERFGHALDSVATRSDVEGLRLVEAHIAELSSQLEQTRGQLARLDAIEAQLTELRHQFSDEEIMRLLGGTVPTEEDLTRFAEDAATRVAQRFLAGMPKQGFEPTGLAERTAEAVQSVQATSSRQMLGIQEMLAAFMDERRRGEAFTAEALETMQQAMQHILERVDAIEDTRVHALQPAAAVVRRQDDRTMLEQVHPEPAYAEPPRRSFADEAKAAAKLAATAAPDLRAAMPGEQRITASERIEPELETLPGMHAEHVDDVATQVVRQKRSSSATAPPVDRKAFIAMARRAAEQANPSLTTRPVAPALAAKPDARKTGALETGSLRDRLFGGTGEAPAKTAVRPGMLLVVGLAASLMAGYFFVSSPKFRTLGSGPAVQRPAPAAQKAGVPVIDLDVTPAPVVVPAEPADPPVEPAKRKRSTPETVVDDLSALPKPKPEPLVPERTAGTGAFGIAIEQSPRTISPEELMRARQKAHLANLSQRTAHDAARTSAVPISHVPNGVLEPMPGAPTAREERTTLELPPAMVGPLSLRLAAAKGDPSTQFEVAARLAEGKGLKQDFEQAAVWYQRAATQGLAPAQYRLATLYERGLGVKGDPARARVWYKRAAEQGNLKAMHNLAVISAGRESGATDYPAALQWFTEAAERGLADSQFNLGILHESGLGIEKDLAQAYKWYALAARGGDKEAARRRDLLMAKLEPEQLKAGEDAIASWRARPADRMANDARAAGDAWKQRAALPPG